MKKIYDKNFGIADLSLNGSTKYTPDFFFY
jgi:hypothetical protein